jgi:hypothetical protein
MVPATNLSFVSLPGRTKVKSRTKFKSNQAAGGSWPVQGLLWDFSDNDQDTHTSFDHHTVTSSNLLTFLQQAKVILDDWRVKSRAAHNLFVKELSGSAA